MDGFDDEFPLRLNIIAQQASGSAQVGAVAAFTVRDTDFDGGFVGLAEGNTVTIDATESALVVGYLESVRILTPGIDEEGLYRCGGASNGSDFVQLENGTSRFRGDVSGDTWSGDYTEINRVTVFRRVPPNQSGTLTFEAEFNVQRQ